MEHLTPARESLVVLYEGGSGRIVHTHRVVTFEGGEHPDEATLEKQAMDQFQLAEPQTRQKVELLHASPGSMKADGVYRVDEQQKMILEVSAQRLNRKDRS